MKRILIHITCLFALFLNSMCASGKETANNSMRLNVMGTHLVNEQGEPVILRGVSYSWHLWHPRWYNAQSVQTFVNDWGLNLVRAAMGVEPEGGYIDNSEVGIACVETVVDQAIACGIYAIIDWHSHHIKTAEAKLFFTHMATKYKGVPNVIYEIYNEPIDDSWMDVKAYSEELINTIRAIDKEAIILVGTPHWDQDIHIAADNPIQKQHNIMYALHFYAGTHKKALRSKADYAIKKGLPLFVSECAAVNADGDGPIDYASWSEWLTWMTNNQLSWAVWSVCDKNESSALMLPTASSIGGWKDSDLSEWGLFIRQELRKNQ